MTERDPRETMTAWFNSGHPAIDEHCQECCARPMQPCVAMVSMPGTCVSAGMPITGFHACRILVSHEVMS